MSSAGRRKKRATPRTGRRQGDSGGAPALAARPGEQRPGRLPDASPEPPATGVPGPVLPPAAVAELELAVASLVKALQDPLPETPAAATAAAPPAPTAAAPPAATPPAPTPPAPLRPEGNTPSPPAAPPPGGTEPPARSRFPRLGWKLLAAALVVQATIIGGLLVTRAGIDSLNADDPPSAPATGVSATGATTPPTTSQSSGTAALGYVPGSTTGPGVTSPGVLVQVSPDASGTLEVVEHIRFQDVTSTLTLAPPLTTGMAPTAVPQGIQVSDLQVAADGNVVTTPVTTFSRATTVGIPPDTQRVEMRYRLHRAATRSTPSTPGRALVLLPPISSGAELIGLPVVVEVKGGSVRNLLCPGLIAGDQLCGRISEDRWYTVQLRPGITAVLAQLDLPAPVGT